MWPRRLLAAPHRHKLSSVWIHHAPAHPAIRHKLLACVGRVHECEWADDGGALGEQCERTQAVRVCQNCGACARKRRVRAQGAGSSCRASTPPAILNHPPTHLPTSDEAGAVRVTQEEAQLCNV